jgi:hypothetical protein
VVDNILKWGARRLVHGRTGRSSKIRSVTYMDEATTHPCSPTNICTPAGLVNGATGEAVGVVVDPEGESPPINTLRYLSHTTSTQVADFHELDELYTFCTKPPPCLLFKPNRSKSISLQSLNQNVLPIFPLEASITVKGYSVRRRQIPICPAFCLTDYKIQGTSLDSAILDLKDDRKCRGQDSHRRFCSTYVQLSACVHWLVFIFCNQLK